MTLSKIDWLFLFFILYNSFSVEARNAKFDSNYAYDSLKITTLVDSAISTLYTDYFTSITYLDSSLTIARAAKRIEDEYWILQWRLTCERYWLKFDEFIDIYNRMDSLNGEREFSSTLDELTWVHDLNLRAAHVYKDLGDVRKARSLYNLVYDRMSSIESLDSRAYQLVRVAKMSLAELHSLEGNFDLATQTMAFVIDQELLQARRSGRKPVLRSNYCRLANYERLKGDFKSSYGHFKEGLIYFKNVAKGDTYKKFASQKYLKRFYPQFAEVCQSLSKYEEYDDLMEHLSLVTKESEKEYLRLLNVKAKYMLSNGEWSQVVELYAGIDDLTIYSKLDRMDFLFYVCSSFYELKMFEELEDHLKFYENELNDFDVDSGEDYYRYMLLNAKLLLSQNHSSFDDYINNSIKNIRSFLYNTGNIWDSNLALKYLKSLVVLQLEKDMSKESNSVKVLKSHFLSSFNQLRDIEKSFSLAKKDARANGISKKLRKIYSVQALLEESRDREKNPFRGKELNSELHRLREERITLLDSLSMFVDIESNGIVDPFHFRTEGDNAQLYLVSHDSVLFRLFTFNHIHFADKLVLDSKEFNILSKVTCGSSIRNKSISELAINFSDVYDLIFRNMEIPTGVSILEIFADEFLSCIPFDLLVRNGRKLLEDCSIVYQPSKTDQCYNNRSVLIAPEFDDDLEEEIGRLLFNSEEVQSIKEYVPNSEILSSIQNLNEFMNSLRGSKIIHFATHSFLNIGNPDYSYLLLTNNRNEQPLRLYQKEIGRWDVSSEMVCLTSCDSGVGEVIEGDGMYSLARNFMAAGAKSVISTLWSINDQSSSFIMKEFYKELKKGKRKDEALRQAKLTYLDQADPEYQHPYYWAAFVAMGDMSPLFDPYKKWKIGGRVLAVLVFVGVGYRKYSALKVAA